MSFIALVTSCLIGQAPPSLSEPAGMQEAWADLKRLPEAERPYHRYLIRPTSWTDKDWGYFRPVLIGQLNHLSRQSIFYSVTTAGKNALRVNTFKYGYTDVWDKLVDPYLTANFVERVKVWPGGVYPADGKNYPPGAFRERWKEVGTYPAVILMDGEEDEKKLNEILYWTGSNAALVRADWFFNQTVAAENRKVGYPEFLRFKNLKEYEELIGFDKKKAEGFRYEIRDAVAISGVTLRPRAIARYDALGGGYWKSIDFANPVGEKHPLRLPGRKVEEIGEAFETYGVLPNGLPGCGAFNAKGVLQRAVPGNIARDSESKSNDPQVHLTVSCIRCHTDGALKDLNTFFRKTLKRPLKGFVYDPDYKKQLQLQEELEQQYFQNIKKALTNDRAAYEAAILECTGLSYKEYSKRVAELWSRYEDATVNTAYAAAEFGLKEEEFRERLLKVINSGYLVPVDIGSLAQKGDDAIALGIREWEEIHGQVWYLIRSVK